MNSLTLPLVLTFLFYFALASPPDLRAAPVSPCDHICSAATRDDAVSCAYKDFGGASLQECLTCLQEGGHVNDGDQDTPANCRSRILPLTRIQPSYRRPGRSINTPRPHRSQSSLLGDATLRLPPETDLFFRPPSSHGRLVPLKGCHRRHRSRRNISPHSHRIPRLLPLPETRSRWVRTYLHP